MAKKHRTIWAEVLVHFKKYQWILPMSKSHKYDIIAYVKVYFKSYFGLYY